MNQSRPVGTNASDSAPGVDDGRVAGAQASVNKPAGRGIAWILVGLVVVAFLAILIARSPDDGRATGDGTAAVSAATTRAEVENSAVPGTQNEPLTSPSQNIGPTGQPATAPAAGQAQAPAQ